MPSDDKAKNQFHADWQPGRHEMAADSPGESAENKKSRKGKKGAEAICRSSVRHSILGASRLLRSDRWSTPVNRRARTFPNAYESRAWDGIRPSLTLFQ